MNSPFLFAAVFSAAPAFASSQFVPMDAPMQLCYAKAMVGMDSVINSRLGIAPEHALELSRSAIYGTPEDPYWTNLLTVILDAYLWPGAPHDYAVRVFFACANQKSAPPTYNAALTPPAP